LFGKDFFGENMILPLCKIQYTKTNRKKAKWKESKNPKIRIFQRICLGFLPASFRSKKIQNPPTPSIDLKRKQEEKKPAF